MGKTGFELTTTENGVYFDMDLSGLAEKVAWITGDDAFLALDRNGDGVINDSGELFGDRTMLSDGTYASSGFEALAEFDSNLDGLIDAHDEVYSKLMLWQDKNHDGISDQDELMSLSDAGITAINLNYTSSDSEENYDSAVLSNVSSVLFEDGTETAVGEFRFDSDTLDTSDIINFQINDEILALPDVRAVGGVHSLHYAMAMDDTGELQELVSAFVASTDYEERVNLVENILYFLCNAADIDPTSRGSYIDARHLAVIETMTDGDFVGLHGANPSYLAGPELEKTFDSLVYAYYSELTTPTIEKYLCYVITKTDEDGSTYNDLRFFKSYVAFHLDKGDLSEIQLIDLGRALLVSDVYAFIEFRTYFNSGNYSYGELIDKCSGGTQGTDNSERLTASSGGEVLLGNGGNDTLNGGSGDDALFGGSGDDTIYGSSGNDVLDGGTGNDKLYGGAGDDTYIFAKGYGTDTISDTNGASTIRLIALSPNEVNVSKSGYDLTIQVRDSEDKLIISNYFRGSNSDCFSFEFKDNNSAVLNKDTLSFAFTVEDNEYMFSYGDGASVIQDNGGEDTLQLGADILHSVFVQTGNDLNILLSGTDDVLTVRDWFNDSSNQIESIYSSDGHSLTNQQVLLLIESMAAYTENNNISWADAVQQDSAEVQSLLQQIWVKN